MIADLEPYLRFAVTGIRNAQGHLSRLPGSGMDELEDADDLLEEAIHWIRRWAEAREIEIRDGMKT